jgi:F-type H+-transporting ATPase subunit alpha
LDDVQIKDIRAFEVGLYKYFESSQKALVEDLTQKKQLDDDIKNRLHAAMKEYSANFKQELAAVATK